MSFHGALDYQYIGLVLDNALLWGNFIYSFSSNNFSATGHDPSISQVSGKYGAYNFNAGIGYRVFGFGSYYIVTRLGSGYYISNIELDFTTLNNIPSVSGSDQDLSTAKATLSGVAANFDLVLGYQLFVSLATELKITYRHIFFKDQAFGSVGFSLGAGYKI